MSVSLPSCLAAFLPSFFSPHFLLSPFPSPLLPCNRHGSNRALFGRRHSRKHACGRLGTKSENHTHDSGQHDACRNSTNASAETRPHYCTCVCGCVGCVLSLFLIFPTIILLICPCPCHPTVQCTQYSIHIYIYIDRYTHMKCYIHHHCESAVQAVTDPSYVNPSVVNPSVFEKR